MNNIRELERRLDRELHLLVKRIIAESKGRYCPKLFNRMLNELGGLNTCRKLLDRYGIPYGLGRLRDLGLLHLSMETLILKKPWIELFTKEELEIAKKRLTDFGYVIPENDWNEIRRG